MKYVLVILALTLLLLTACSSGDATLNDLEDYSSEDAVAGDAVNEIIPDLVDSDEVIEIGEMI